MTTEVFVKEGIVVLVLTRQLGTNNSTKFLLVGSRMPNALLPEFLAGTFCISE